ncbi:MAG: hypothetical protein IJO63_01480 [Bacilli bacterium]|nr:hypothetical protein [Bacilli bacterium]
MSSREEVYVLSLLYSAKGMKVTEIKDVVGFVKDNQEIFTDPEVLNYVYQNTLVISKKNGLQPNDVISCLIRRYIDNHPDKNDYLTKFFANNEPSEVYTFFTENPHFGIGLIRDFIANVDKVYTQGFDEVYGLKMKFDTSAKVVCLPDMIRQAFYRFYNNVCLRAGTPVSPPQLFIMAINGYAFVNGNEELKQDMELLKTSQPFLIRIMYADVFEDLAVSGLLKVNKLPINAIINKAIEEDLFTFPDSEEEIERLFNHFNYLMVNPEKRLTNRKSLDNSYIETLNKINPFWMLQEREEVKKR